MRSSFRLVGMLLMGLGCVASGADLTAGRRQLPIDVDGQLDEADWAAAPSAGGFRVLASRSGKAPTAETWFKVVADTEAVYLGVHCSEPDMAKLKAQHVPRDGAVFQQDVVEIFIDPQGNGTEYYQFVVSAANDQWDQYFIENGNTTIGPYSSVWESAVHRGNDFWSLEVRLPLKALFFTRSTAFAQEWLLNVARERKPVIELSTWSPLVNGFHEPERFRRVAGILPKPARYDLAVTDVGMPMTSVSDTGYTGALALGMSATPATAGSYRLRVTAGDTTVLQDIPVEIAAGDSTVTVPGATFRALGRHEARIELRTKEGEVVCARYFPLRVAHTPMTFDVTEPFYRNCIFPGQQVTRLKGEIRCAVPAERLQQARFIVTLNGPGLPGPVTRETAAAERVPFDFDIRTLATGTATLGARVMQGDTVVAEAQTTVRKLAPAPGSALYVDQHLRLVVDGKPTFVRGWYGPTWMVGWAFQQKYPTPKDKCAAYNMGSQLGVEPERIDPKARAAARQDTRPGQRIFDTIRERVEAHRTDKDLWWYYLCDEPECRQISPVYLRFLYDYLKELDPYRPVMIITRAPERYTECADILNPHPYLNPMVDAEGQRTMKSPKAIRTQLRTVLEAGRHRILPMLTPQAFTYGFINRFADYPTFDEFRCMMWAAVANDCRGFTPFIYHGSLERPGLRIGSDVIYQSMAVLDDMLLAPVPDQAVTVEADDDGVDARIVAYHGKLLVVAVNLLDRPLRATLRSEALGNAALHPLRGGSMARPRNGALTLDFLPYEAKVLTNPVRPGLTSLAAVRDQIAAAEAARRQPGNILFGRGREIEFTASSTYISMKSLQTSLCDGMLDVLGWRHINGPTPAWIELAFPTFVPRFRKATVYGNRLGGMELHIWKRGKWQLLWKAPEHVGLKASFEAPEAVRTVKLRLVLPNSRRGHEDGGEVYEVELFE